MYTELGKYLRTLRVQRGEKLLDMAKRLDVSTSYLSGIEYGRRKPPEGMHYLISDAYSLSIEEASRLSKAYSLSRDSFSINPTKEIGKEIAVALARRMNTLSNDKLEKIKKLLEEEDDDFAPFPYIFGRGEGYYSSGVGALNYVVRPRSWAEIDSIAQQFRQRYDIERAKINPIEILEFSMFDKQNVHLQIYGEEEMGLTEGFTDFHGEYIVLREDVYEAAWENNCRARFTVAHEIGHVELHKGQINGMTRMPAKNDKDYVLSEPQANHFAACLLMPFKHFKATDIPNSVKKRFGVSNTAARIRLDKFRESLGISGPELPF